MVKMLNYSKNKSYICVLSEMIQKNNKKNKKSY